MKSRAVPNSTSAAKRFLREDMPHARQERHARRLLPTTPANRQHGAPVKEQPLGSGVMYEG
eukprot:scaffold25847_cov59-Phaeocystis_antarctica.AAC.6